MTPLASLCAHCQTAVIPSSRATDGVATEYCGTCDVESLTTVQGFHIHDQRERLETQLAREHRRDSSPPNPKYQHGRTMHSMDV